jgi:NADH:ubiquinone oxidoreductase subunit E
MMGHVSKNKLEDIVGFEGQEDMVDVKATFCFERCERGPVVRINNKIIEHATYEIAKEVLYKEIEKVGALLES